MSCDWFEERLQDILDERQDPAEDPWVRSHAQRCSGCRSLLELQRRLFLVFPGESLREAEELAIAVSADDETLIERPGEGRITWRKWTALASSGAVVAALLAIVMTGPAAQRPVVASRASDSPGVEEFVKSTVLEPIGSRGGGGLAGVELVDDGLPPMGERPLAQWVSQLGESISTLPAPNLDGVQELAEGIRPLTDSVGSMVEALRQRWQGSRVERMSTVPDTSCVVDWSWVV